MSNIITVVQKMRGIREFYLALGAAFMLSFGLVSVHAQKQKVQVSYDVEFSMPGTMMYAGVHCPTGVGFDKLTGTIMGLEPADAHENNVYEGILTRTTQLSFCYEAASAGAPDQFRACSVTIKGKADGWFRFELYGDKRGGYLQLIDKPVKVYSSSVTGTCDGAEMAEWQTKYGEMATGGSPDGQPINIVTMPRIGPFPKVFAPLPRPTQALTGSSGPSAGEAGTWTLTVRGRRP